MEGVLIDALHNSEAVSFLSLYVQRCVFPSQGAREAFSLCMTFFETVFAVGERRAVGKLDFLYIAGLEHLVCTSDAVER